MKKKLAIVGVFFDGYKDIWEDFLELFNKFWSDCPYDVYIVNQVESVSNYSNLKVINAGFDAEYSKKIQVALNNIDSDYYLLLLEDFFLSKKLDKDILENIMQYIIDNKIKYFAMPLSEFSGSHKGKKVKGLDNCKTISSKSEYTVSCQPAIWEKNFLKQCIGQENYNAWIFEGIYCKSKIAHTEEFLNKCLVKLDNPLSLKHGALQGKMIPDTIYYYNNIGYKMKNTREILSTTIYRKHKMKAFVKKILPLKIQKIIKKHFKTNSVIEKYNNQIYQIMDKMHLD